MLGRRLALLVGVLLCVVSGGLVLGGASALALNEHLFSGFFGGQVGGNGQLLEPIGVAVNAPTHDVYVADRGNDRVEVFSSAGAYISQFDGSAAPTGVFSAPNAIAIDNSGNALDPSAGDVYVVDSGHDVIDKFTSAGTYLGQITETTGGAAFGELEGVAVDANGVVWVYQASGEIDSLSDALGNEYLSKRESPCGVTPGIAVDAEDDLYVHCASGTFAKLNSSGEVLIEAVDSESSSGAVVDLSSGEVFIDELHTIGAFSSMGSFIERFGREQGIEHLSGGTGLAVDPANGTVYVADFTAGVVAVFTAVLVPDVTTGAASGVQPTSVTLGGTVNPDGVQLSDCRFEYGTSTAYGQSAPCVPAAGSIPADSSEHAVSANLTGLVDGSTYHYRLRAGNASGANFGEDATFQTPPRPTIDSAAATNLTRNSVDLNGRIDPRGFDTTYRFEWGTSTAYGTSVPVPDGDIGAGTSDVTMSRHLSGLSTNTTYHWRVVAQNANGTVTGRDHTFIYSTSGAGLPDNRAYEMVTPSHKSGALIGNVFFGLGPDIGEDGSRLMLSTLQCFGDVTSCPVNEYVVGTSYAFTRTSGGWRASGLGPPATQFAINDAWGVSADAGTALFTMPTAPVGEQDWYARGADGSFRDIGPTVPLSPGNLGHQLPVSLAWEATADVSHVVFEDEPRWPFDATKQGKSLYEYVGVGNAAPVLVGVSGGRGSTDLISECGTVLGHSQGGEIPLSADGRTVFFTVEPCASGSGANAGVEVPKEEVFARIDESRTAPVSARSPLECTAGSTCLGSPPGDARFAGASDDGSKAFFLDTQQLTDNASEDSQGDSAYGGGGCSRAVGLNGCNLYEYDFANPAGRNLLAVSAGDISGGGPRAQGVTAISPDGSHVYFIAKGVLTGTANDRGEKPQDGANNLYVFERDASHPAGRVTFIATLSEADRQEWTSDSFFDDVTPDGRFLVFTSHGALTADDFSSSGAAQVFRYDAQTGELIRISAGESGFNDNGNAGVGNAHIVETAGPGFKHLGPRRDDPTMSHDGSFVFFESPVALTPGALDDVRISAEDLSGEPGYAENVYEWHEGHVYLISDGRDVTKGLSAPCNDHESSVCLLGTDATGRNVFFTTADALLPEDGDTAEDVYDARICTPGDPCIAPTVTGSSPCESDACHGTPAGTPLVVGAGTVAFSGPGNLAPQASVVKSKAKKHKPKARRRTRKRRPKRHAGRSSKRHGHTSRAGVK